jgi:hypothetical protein
MQSLPPASISRDASARSTTLDTPLPGPASPLCCTYVPLIRITSTRCAPPHVRMYIHSMTPSGALRARCPSPRVFLSSATSALETGVALSFFPPWVWRGWRGACMSGQPYGEVGTRSDGGCGVRVCAWPLAVRPLSRAEQGWRSCLRRGVGVCGV